MRKFNKLLVYNYREKGKWKKSGANTRLFCVLTKIFFFVTIFFQIKKLKFNFWILYIYIYVKYKLQFNFSFIKHMISSENIRMNIEIRIRFTPLLYIIFRWGFWVSLKGEKRTKSHIPTTLHLKQYPPG